MPKIQYISHKFNSESVRVIQQAEDICQQYAAQGFDLTLRQLYYQFVSRGLIPNRDTEYKKLGSIINDARLAGLIDWNHITDRTRNVRSESHWSTPASIIDSAATSYATDKWATQFYRPEVWIEKDALIGVLDAVCPANDVPYFSCRGYTSQSEMWGAAMRLVRYFQRGQTPVIIHLGDHDPSGIDMSRDIAERLQLFVEHHGYRWADVRRIALNYDQVRQYDPPPNPAKTTDARATKYINEFGDESWELDALDPNVIVNLVQDTIDGLKDHAAWNIAVDEQENGRRQLEQVAQQWDDVVAYFPTNDADEDGDSN